jgi:hypothetical protein
MRRRRRSGRRALLRWGGLVRVGVTVEEGAWRERGAGWRGRRGRAVGAGVEEERVEDAAARVEDGLSLFCFKQERRALLFPPGREGRKERKRVGSCRPLRGDDEQARGRLVCALLLRLTRELAKVDVTAACGCCVLCVVCVVREGGGQGTSVRENKRTKTCRCNKNKNAERAALSPRLPCSPSPPIPKIEGLQQLSLIFLLGFALYLSNFSLSSLSSLPKNKRERVGGGWGTRGLSNL